MAYFIINTDKNNGRQGKAYDIWYETGMAFAGDSGQDIWKHTGFFKKVKPGDYVFMYQSGEGIVGLGEVLENWDERKYVGKARLYYGTDDYEYRIKIDWKSEYDTRNDPLIGKEYLPYRSWYAKINEDKWDVEKVKKLLKLRATLSHG